MKIARQTFRRWLPVLLAGAVAAGCERSILVGESASTGGAPGGVSGAGGAFGVRAPALSLCDPISTYPGDINLCGRTFGLAFSPDGQIIASASDTPPPNVHLWRLSDGVRLHDLPGFLVVTYNVAFSPDGRLLAAAGNVGQGSTDTVKIYDVASGAEVRTLPTSSGFYSSAAVFSNDGVWLATAGAMGSIEIWRASDWTRVLAIPYPASVHNLHFAPSGSRLITGGVDQVATVWDIPSGNQVFTLSPIAGEMADAEYSPAGNLIASTGPGNGVLIWDAATHAVVQTLSGHAAYVSQTVWVDQNTLLSDDWSGVVKIWARATTAEFMLRSSNQTGAQGLKMAVSPDRKCAAVEAGAEPSGSGFMFMRF
jgi:WD40 repeat protein